MSPEYRNLLETGGYIWKVKNAREFTALADRFCVGLTLLRVLSQREIPAEIVTNEKEKNNYISQLRRQA